MTLRELLKTSDCFMYIRQGLKWGTSGSSPIGKFSGRNAVPEHLLDREIRSLQPVSHEQYGRTTGALDIVLNGYIEYE